MPKQSSNFPKHGRNDGHCLPTAVLSIHMTFMEEELKTFVESEVTCYIATRNHELQPECGFVWAPRLVSEREVEFFLDREASVRMVANLRENRQVAITLSSPLTYRAVQLKGWCSDIRETALEDASWLDRHHELVTEVLRARGLPAQISRTFWSRDTVKVRCVIESKFNQTPGPGAGGKL
jgi:hypothetical protein